MITGGSPTCWLASWCDLDRTLDVPGWHGAGEQIALNLVASEELELSPGHLGLDAFGEHREPERMPEVDDRLGDGEALVIDQVGDQDSVDLECVDGERSEVSERRVAGSKIVDRDAYAQLPQLSQHV